MKTHDLARQLTSLAKALKALPNMEVDGLSKLVPTNSAVSDESIAMGLTTMAALSDIDKQQWHMFIQQHKLPIEIRPRDASRDIIGKILTYLQNDREASQRLARSAAEKPTTSPELQRALQLLLR